MKSFDNLLFRRMILPLVAGITLCVPAAAQAPMPAMFDSLERGAWTLRDRATGATRQICLKSGMEFVQLRHTQPGCERVVVQDDPGEVTVQYTCRGNGYGRTTVRREDSRLVQVQSQGIVDGSPFRFNGEARHSGSC